MTLPDGEQLSALIEQRVAELSDVEFEGLVSRTRPPKLGELMTHREAERSIALKRQLAQQRAAQKKSQPNQGDNQ